MNKNILKKIAYELNNELKGNTREFIFLVCNKYLKFHGIFNREKWLRTFINFNERVSRNTIEIIDKYDEEFESLESIGWLYQYFISEEKERVFSNLKKNIKIEKGDIPYATQLFTPDWIVKYLVQNSLGRYTNLQNELDYYIPSKDKDIIEKKKLEELKFLDPCQGTGHILLYAFELFFKAYKNNGFSNLESVTNILTKNLYGIDLDETACLIAKLVLIIKSATVYEEIFDSDIINKMNIICIKNTNQLSLKKYGEIVHIFFDADEFGSLIRPSKIELPKEDNTISDFIKQYKMLYQKYDIVCTNPPYMGKKNINKKLSEFLKNVYPDTKSEMYAAFIERCLDFTEDKGYLSMITIHSWMFISSFLKLRNKIIDNGTIINMLHTGAATFDDLSSFNALATSFILKKEKINIESCFVRLANYYNIEEKINNFKNKQNYYYLKQNKFNEIPNSPFIYWISEKIRKCFAENKKINDFYHTKQGLATGNNKEFVKMWYEVPYSDIGFNYKTDKEFFSSR